MPEPDAPTKENPDDGPECPECGATTNLWRNQLSEDEYTSSIDCPECDFEIESESNLAAEDRLDQ